MTRMPSTRMIEHLEGGPTQPTSFARLPSPSQPVTLEGNNIALSRANYGRQDDDVIRCASVTLSLKDDVSPNNSPLNHLLIRFNQNALLACGLFNHSTPSNAFALWDVQCLNQYGVEFYTWCLLAYTELSTSKSPKLYDSNAQWLDLRLRDLQAHFQLRDYAVLEAEFSDRQTPEGMTTQAMLCQLQRFQEAAVSDFVLWPRESYGDAVAIFLTKCLAGLRFTASLKVLQEDPVRVMANIFWKFERNLQSCSFSEPSLSSVADQVESFREDRCQSWLADGSDDSGDDDIGWGLPNGDVCGSGSPVLSAVKAPNSTPVSQFPVITIPSTEGVENNTPDLFYHMVLQADEEVDDEADNSVTSETIYPGGSSVYVITREYPTWEKAPTNDELTALLHEDLATTTIDHKVIMKRPINVRKDWTFLRKEGPQSYCLYEATQDRSQRAKFWWSRKLRSYFPGSLNSQEILMRAWVKLSHMLKPKPGVDFPPELRKACALRHCALHRVGQRTGKPVETHVSYGWLNLTSRSPETRIDWLIEETERLLCLPHIPSNIEAAERMERCQKILALSDFTALEGRYHHVPQNNISSTKTLIRLLQRFLSFRTESVVSADSDCSHEVRCYYATLCLSVLGYFPPSDLPSRLVHVLNLILREVDRKVTHQVWRADLLL